MASCTRIENSLQSFIDGVLSDSEHLILENHLQSCPSCSTLLAKHKQCNAEIFEAFAKHQYKGDMTAYILEHLPELTPVHSTSGSELELVNRRAKHPRPQSDFLKRLVPVAAALLIVGLAYVLKENWPSAGVPDNAIGAVTYQSGQSYKISAQTHKQETARLKTFAVSDDLFETDSGSHMMITLAGPTAVKLAPDTRVCIHDDRTISVEQGRVYLDVSKNERAFRVLTPNGIVTVFGTAFEVNVGTDQTTVSVSEGEVQVEKDNLFKQVFPGEQVRVTRDMTVMQTIQVDVEQLTQWSDSMVPDSEMIEYVADQFGTTVSLDVVRADSVYHLPTQGHAIKYVELEWSPTVLADNVGYQVYVYSDKDVLMFKGAVNSSTIGRSHDATIRIHNNTNPEMETRFAFVRIVSDSVGREGDLKFINCNAVLQK